MAVPYLYLCNIGAFAQTSGTLQRNIHHATG